MNDTSLNLPWVRFILTLWLKNEVQDDHELYSVAEALEVITVSDFGWHVNNEWFLNKLEVDAEISNIDTPEVFSSLILGLGEFMARVTDYRAQDVVEYINKAPAAKHILECLSSIEAKTKAFFPENLDLSVETIGELQFVNSAQITPEYFHSVDRLFGNGPRNIIRSRSYGLSCGLDMLLKIDGPAVGIWLQNQDHPLILDAALYALKYAFMMILSPGHEQEVVQLLRSGHSLVSLTGLVVTHSAHLSEGHPVWSIPLDEAFKLVESANIPIEVSIWTSLFRVAEISKSYEREKRHYEESKRHYAYASEDPDYLYGKKEYHYESMERQTKQKEFLKNIAEVNIREIISHWPKNGLPNETLKYCAEIVSSNEMWLQFLEKIPVSQDKEYTIKLVINKFIHSSDLFKHNERSHCYATEQMLDDADFVAKLFLLLSHKNLGKSFGKLFFSDNTESLRLDDKILSEPYAYRERFTAYNHALNGLGIAHYIAIQIGTEGVTQKREGASFLLEKGMFGLLKVVAAAQGSWDVAEEALQRLSFTLLESLSLHKEIISNDELEPFLELPQLQYAFRAMLGFSRYGLLKKHSDHILMLLKQSLLPAVIWQNHFKSIASSFLAFDFALMRLAKADDHAMSHNIVALWQNGLVNHTDPIPTAFIGAIEKIEKALLGDKQCFDWLMNNPSLSNTWSANYLRGKIAGDMK